MSSFLAVFGREIAERRLLFWTGLSGFAPFLLPLVGSNSGADLKSASAFVLAGVVCGVLSLGLGASVVARDLAERRLGFYFARPLSAWSIWAGKLGAALALALAAGLLVLLPVLVFDRGVRGDLANGGWGQVAAGAGIAALLVLFADVVSLMVRTRSAWLAFDFVAAGAVGLLGWDAAERLLRAGQVSAFGDRRPEALLLRALLFVAPFALTALVAGSAAQLVGGRTDPRRGHRLLSTTLWGLLLAAALGLAGYSRWLVAATPSDLVAFDVALPARAGNAVLVQGHAAHRGDYHPFFLVDPESGRFHRLFPSLHEWEDTVQVSADGRWAVWREPQDLQGRAPAVVVRLDLARPAARPVPTRLTLAAGSSALALSPDGRRLATVAHGRLLVEELETGRLLASFPLAAMNWRNRLLFLSASRLRYFQSLQQAPGEEPEARVAVTDFDLAAGRREEIGRTARFEDSATWEPSPDGSHLLVHRPLERLALFAARGGAPLAELPARAFGSGFLADGRVVATSPGGEPKELVLLSPDGAVLRRFPFPGVRSLRLGGEPLRGQLVIAMAATGASSDRAGHWESHLLDLSTGESRSLGRGLLPAAGPGVGPASAGSRLFFRGDRLVRLDPASRREHLVAGR